MSRTTNSQTERTGKTTWTDTDTINLVKELAKASGITESSKEYQAVLEKGRSTASFNESFRNLSNHQMRRTKSRRHRVPEVAKLPNESDASGRTEGGWKGGGGAGEKECEGEGLRVMNDADGTGVSTDPVQNVGIENCTVPFGQACTVPVQAWHDTMRGVV